jgi:predicted MFS family arabinose efflux permease
MQSVAGVWLMTSLTVSPVMVSLMQTATSLPVFLVVLPAAAMVDIVDRRKMLLFTQGWMCAAAAGLSISTFWGGTGAWELLAFTFALGLGSAMNVPLWQALVPRLVPATELPAAVALNGVAFNIARAVGPAMGGAVVALAGPGPVFLLNAISFTGVMFIVYKWESSGRRNFLPPERVIGAMKTGVRYMFYAPPLRAVLIRCLLFITCVSALWALMPVVARHELRMSSIGFGGLFGFIGMGALLGAAILPRLRSVASTDRLINIASAVLVVAILVLGIIRNVYIVYGAMLLAGIAWITAMASLTVAAQTLAPSWVQGRALGFYTLAFQGGMAVASVGWGLIAEKEGNPFALVCAAGLLIITILFSLRWGQKIGSDQDLRPSLHWPEPILITRPNPEEGPVLVLLEYHIDPAKADDFVEAAHELGRIRRRDGGRQWGLFRDLAEPARYIETFQVESWAEHLRQHGRITVADRAIEDRVRAFHIGGNPPAVSHFLYQERASANK